MLGMAGKLHMETTEARPEKKLVTRQKARQRTRLQTMEETKEPKTTWNLLSTGYTSILSMAFHPGDLPATIQSQSDVALARTRLIMLLLCLLVPIMAETRLLRRSMRTNVLFFARLEKVSNSSGT
jgi:hypothetical protein